MKMRIPMNEVLDILHSLENQNDTESKNIYNKLYDIFKPLMDECGNSMTPPVYEVEINDDSTSNQHDIDWENRRYELVKDLMVSYMTSHPNMDLRSSSIMRSILINATRQADFIIAGLQQEDIIHWDCSLY